MPTLTFHFSGLTGTLVAVSALLSCSSKSAVFPESQPVIVDPSLDELHRVLIENVEKGRVLGSTNGGKSWQEIGTVVVPVKGQVWNPSLENGVKAFDFLRGPSNVFATAVNNLHLRFSDPVGYSLPADVDVPPPIAHGISYAPFESLPADITTVPKRIGILSNKGGEGIFGPEWSPRVGSAVYQGDFARSQFSPIPYIGVVDTKPEKASLLIVTSQPEQNKQIEMVEFENKTNGRVLVQFSKKSPVAVAKVLKAVEGVGRFSGSEYNSKPGVLRANHAGVICIGTTDINLDSSIPEGTDINELRGGFQVVPSHHWQDASMNSGGNHAEVYLVVGPIQDPPDLKRYDRSVDGTFPLFNNGLRAGGGQTYLQFAGKLNEWVEMDDAVKRGLFTTREGVVIEHLRGYIKDAFHNVTGIRFYPNR